MRINRHLFISWVLLILLLSSCRPKSEDKGITVLNVMTHDSFAVSENIIQLFERENNAQVKFLLSGDTGAALNRAILTKNSPQADVFYGVDNTFLSRALSEGIFEPYASNLINELSEDLLLDPSQRLLPADYGDVCINYDRAYFSAHSLALTVSLQDLTLPQYRGLLVVENPATSSPGLAFLMATIAEFGSDGFINFWKELRANGLVVVNDWESAYYSNFSASSGKGSQPMVVSYSSSPAAEVIFADPPVDDAPTASLMGKNMCFRQVEFVGILAGTKQRDLAEKFVDFVLSVPFQEDIPLQMFVYPANKNAKLPKEFSQYAQTAKQPATLDPQLIADYRDAWIEEWTAAVLR